MEKVTPPNCGYSGYHVKIHLLRVQNVLCPALELIYCVSVHAIYIYIHFLQIHIHIHRAHVGHVAQVP